MSVPATNNEGLGKTGPSKKSPKNLRGPKPILPIWASEGVKPKPESCDLCPFHTSSVGFCPDWYPDYERSPRLGFLLDFPSSDDILEQRPWVGKTGFAWERKYLTKFGLTLKDVYIGHVLRCQPKVRKFGRPQYPTSSVKRGAEITCRKHDDKCWGGPVVRSGGVKSFDPDLFLCTFHPQDAIQTPALGRLVECDVEKAIRFTKKGHRVLVLMGDEARELVAPWASKGGCKVWRGHWFRGSWPFKENSMLVEPGGFMAA